MFAVTEVIENAIIVLHTDSIIFKISEDMRNETISRTIIWKFFQSLSLNILHKVLIF